MRTLGLVGLGIVVILLIALLVGPLFVPVPPLAGTVEAAALVDADSRMRGHRVERIGELRTEDGNTRLLVRAPDIDDGAEVVTTQLPNALDGLLVRSKRAG